MSYSDNDDAPPPPVLARADFEAVFRNELRYVWNSVRRLGVREADLEDVAHEVFVTFFRRLSEFDASRPVRPWLFGIASRIASDYRRSAPSQREVLSGTELARPAPLEEESRREDRDLLLAALESVHPDRLPVLVMHDVDGHDMPDIALALGIPLNTGYSRLRLARQEVTAAVRRLRCDREGGVRDASR